MLHNVEILRGTTPTIGTWFSIGSPVIAEIASLCGVRWGLFDHEQGASSEAALPENLRAVGTGALIPLVRVGSRIGETVTRALNWGAAGIMFPHVESVEDAENCVRLVHYPPRGVRGVSRSTRFTNYGIGANGFDAKQYNPLVVVQIESLKGARNAAAIAAVEGVDMLFVGPVDLGYDLSVHEPDPRFNFDGCLQAVVSAANTHGKSTGILVRQPEDVPHLRSLGFNHLAMDSDMAIVRRRYMELAAM